MATTTPTQNENDSKPPEGNRFLRRSKRMIIGIHQSGFNYSIDEAVDLFTDNLKQKMEDEQADIFQVASVLRCHGYHENADETLEPIYSSYIIWRCLLCAFLQLVITPLVAVSLVLDTFVMKRDLSSGEVQEVHQFCNMESFVFDDIVGKLVAFSFSVYIWFLYVKEQENNNVGPANFLILQKNVVPTTVDGLLYIWGYCVNITSQFVTAVSATAIIMATGTSIDIMLNSLAIFFINGLDDILATKVEYQTAAMLMARGLVRDEEERANLVNGNQEQESVKYRPVRAAFKPFKWNGIFSSFVTLIIVSCGPFVQLACWRAKEDN